MFAAIRFRISAMPVVTTDIVMKSKRSDSRLCITIIGLLFVFVCPFATAQSNQEWLAYKRNCGIPMGLDYASWVRQGSHCPAREAGNSYNDNGAAQRAQEAAAEAAAAAKRQRDAELEQQRIDAKNQRRAEEAERQAKFEQDKREALGQLKGIADGDDSDSASGLKGAGSAESDLKDAPNSGDSTELKTLPNNSDNRALKQARVAAGQGNLANESLSDSGASGAARHPFDTAGGVAASMPVVPGTPTAASVPERIKKMPAYQAKVAEKEKLQNQLTALDSRLNAIRAEQAKSPTPNQDLVMEAVEVKQEMSPIRGEILLKQQQIDKFVVSMEEGSAPDKGKDKTQPKTIVPSPAQ